MAGFEVTLHGRFWVITEAKVVYQKSGGNNADRETENENPC
jgi:hypothetical protein